MTNEEAIRRLECMDNYLKTRCNDYSERDHDAFLLAFKSLNSERPKGEWIPIKTRPLTEDEKEEYPDFSFMYDCQMPEDGEEVLITTKFGVCTDTFCWDYEGCYFEDHYDEDEVLAWQKLPEPYKEANNDT